MKQLLGKSAAGLFASQTRSATLSVAPSPLPRFTRRSPDFRNRIDPARMTALELERLLRWREGTAEVWELIAHYASRLARVDGERILDRLLDLVAARLMTLEATLISCVCRPP